MRTRLWMVGVASTVLLGLAGYAFWRVSTTQVETAHAAPLSTIPALVGPVDEVWFAARLLPDSTADKSCGGCHTDACAMAAHRDHEPLACTVCHGAAPILASPKVDSPEVDSPELAPPEAVDSLGEAVEMPVHPIERSDAFASPALCVGCHADRKDEYRFGKALVETIEEWRRTPAAAEGRACVACHGQARLGPRGMHDSEFARTAFTASAKFISNGDRMVGKLTVRATADVGHRWPSRASREQGLQIEQVDRGGLGLEGSFREGVVGRRLGGSAGELFDTRLMPGEEKVLLYEARLDPDAAAMVARVVRYTGGSAGPLVLWEQRVELPGAE